MSSQASTVLTGLSADDVNLVLPLSQQLYQLIVRQLQFDGYVAAAAVVADTTGVIVPGVEDDGNRLLRLVARGLACEAMDARATSAASQSRVVERYINAAKVHMPLAVSSDALIGRRAHAVHETFCTAALGGAVRDVAFSPDGELIACAGANGLASILSWQTIHDLVVQDDVRERRLANVAGADGRKYCGDTSASRVGCRRGAHTANDITELAVARHLREHVRNVEFVRFHPCFSVVASGGHDRCLYLHNYTQPNTHAMLCVRDEHVMRAAAFHPGGEYVLYATDHPVVRLANVQTGAVLTSALHATQTEYGTSHDAYRANRTAHTAGLTSVAYAHDGRVFATSSLDGTWALYDGASGKAMHRVTDAHSNVPVTSVKFSQTNNYVLTSGMDAVARLWDVRYLATHTTTQQHNLTTSADGIQRTYAAREVASFGEPLKCEHRSIRALFNASESQIVMQDASLQSIQYFDILVGDVTCTTTTTPAFMQYALAASTLNGVYATGGDDNRVHLWQQAYTK